MSSSDTSTVISSGSSSKRCKSCKEDLPETKFKTNGYVKGTTERTRMATCRNCTDSVSSGKKSSSVESISQSDDMVRMKKLQTIETLVKIGVKSARHI